MPPTPGTTRSVALVTLGYDVPIYLDGLVIVEVLEGSAAQGVLSPGETIVAIDGRDVQGAVNVGSTIRTNSPDSSRTTRP